MKINKILHTLWPALLWSVIIFILLSIPGPDLPPGPDIPLFDKIIHVFLFGTQVYLWCMYLSGRVNFSIIPGIFFLTFILSSLYGIGMEYYQKYFVVNRGFEISDMIADVTGSLIGWMLYKALSSKKTKRG